MNTNKLAKYGLITAGSIVAIVTSLLFWAVIFQKMSSPSIEPVDDVYGALQRGKWGWALAKSDVSCDKNPHTIMFRKNNSEAVLTFQKKLKDADGKEIGDTIYKIVRKNGNRITMKIIGEKRLDENGQPVVWDLVMLNKNEYAWHRLDWSDGVLTSRIYLCQ